MADEDTDPAIEILGGLLFDPLPDGWTPIEGIMLLKCLDETGSVQWCGSATTNLVDQEILGALEVEHALRKRDLVDRLVEEERGDGC